VEVTSPFRDFSISTADGCAVPEVSDAVTRTSLHCECKHLKLSVCRQRSSKTIARDGKLRARLPHDMATHGFLLHFIARAANQLQLQVETTQRRQLSGSPFNIITSRFSSQDRSRLSRYRCTPSKGQSFPTWVGAVTQFCSMYRLLRRASK